MKKIKTVSAKFESKLKAKTPKEMAEAILIVGQMKETENGLTDIADRLLKSMGKDFRKGVFDEQKACDLLTLSNARNVMRTLYEHYSQEL